MPQATIKYFMVWFGWLQLLNLDWFVLWSDINQIIRHCIKHGLKDINQVKFGFVLFFMVWFGLV